MGRSIKYNKETKITIVKRYLNGESASALANEYNMPRTMYVEISKWAKRYQIYGESAFTNISSSKYYSDELKETVVKEYLEGKTSINDLVLKYNISSNSVVIGWLKKYNITNAHNNVSYKELKETLDKLKARAHLLKTYVPYEEGSSWVGGSLDVCVNKLIFMTNTLEQALLAKLSKNEIDNLTENIQLMIARTLPQRIKEANDYLLFVDKINTLLDNLYDTINELQHKLESNN